MQGNKRMEEIMMEIKEHLKPVIDYGANENVHHYNRVWEKIDRWFIKWKSEENVESVANSYPNITELRNVFGTLKIQTDGPIDQK